MDIVLLRVLVVLCQIFDWAVEVALILLSFFYD